MGLLGMSTTFVATSNVATDEEPDKFNHVGLALEELIERKGGKLRKTVDGDKRYPKVELEVKKLHHVQVTEKEL